MVKLRLYHVINCLSENGGFVNTDNGKIGKTKYIYIYKLFTGTFTYFFVHCSGEQKRTKNSKITHITAQSFAQQSNPLTNKASQQNTYQCNALQCLHCNIAVHLCIMECNKVPRNSAIQDQNSGVLYDVMHYNLFNSSNIYRHTFHQRKIKLQCK